MSVSIILCSILVVVTTWHKVGHMFARISKLTIITMRGMYVQLDIIYLPKATIEVLGTVVYT